MSDLSQDELTVLLIAAKGEPMIPIGRWKVPTESLIARGYMQPRKSAGDPTGHFNNYITASGMAAVEKADDATMLTMTTLSASIEHEQRKIRANAEQIAVQMVDLAMASSQVTGDAPRDAMEKWAKLIGKRALELLR